METLDWINRTLTKDSLAGLKNCIIITKKEQFDELALKVEIVDHEYISHLAILFTEAKIRNIKFARSKE